MNHSKILIRLCMALLAGVFINGCDNSPVNNSDRINALADSLKAASAAFDTKNAEAQAGILQKIGQELEMAGLRDSALATYSEARATCGRCPLADSIARCIQRLEEAEPVATAVVWDPLLGEHKFGVQFIWDGYGKATITQDGEKRHIQGSQYSKDKEDYVLIEGELIVKNERQLVVDGEIKTQIKDCCGNIDKKGKFTFQRTGDRKFYRLQEREQFCDMYVCHYYIDLFL